jgi:hypothetical protein
MTTEFNSPSRQQRVVLMVSALKFNQFVKDDYGNALNELVERISNVSFFTPKGDAGAPHK